MVYFILLYYFIILLIFLYFTILLLLCYFIRLLLSYYYIFSYFISFYYIFMYIMFYFVLLLLIYHSSLIKILDNYKQEINIYEFSKLSSTTAECCLPALLQFSSYIELFLGSLRFYGLPPCKMSHCHNLRYLELIFWSLGSILVTISNFSEDVSHRNYPMKALIRLFKRLIFKCFFLINRR